VPETDAIARRLQGTLDVRLEVVDAYPEGGALRRPRPRAGRAAERSGKTRAATEVAWVRTRSRAVRPSTRLCRNLDRTARSPGRGSAMRGSPGGLAPPREGPRPRAYVAPEGALGGLRQGGEPFRIRHGQMARIFRSIATRLGQADISRL